VIAKEIVDNARVFHYNALPIGSPTRNHTEEAEETGSCRHPLPGFVDDDKRSSTSLGSVSSKEASFEFFSCRRLLPWGQRQLHKSLNSLPKPQISLEVVVVVHKRTKNHHNCSL